MSLDENSPLPSDLPPAPDSLPDYAKPELLLISAQTDNVSVTPDFSVQPASALPEDLRAPWGWSDLLVFAIISIAATFLVAILIVAVLAAFGVHLPQLQKAGSAQGLFAVLSQAVLFLGLLAYLAMQMRIRFDAPFWRTIGWHELPRIRLSPAFLYLSLIGGGFLLALLVQVGSVLFGEKTTLPMEALFQDRLTALLLLLMAVLLAPVVEETIFRGYIYPVVARSFGVGVGVFATGTLFGLLHAPQLWGGWVQIGLLIIVGIVFTYVRAVTRTVFASYLLHVSYNFYVSCGFLIGSHWLRNVHPGS
jgi:membrane protease YdiL (CAAX protease family)